MKIIASSLVLLLSAVVETTNAFVVVPPAVTSKQSLGSSLAFAPVFKQQQQRQQRSNNDVLLFMGWGPEPIWSDATIDGKATPACESGKSVVLTLTVPPETAAEYKVPGQYVQIKPKGVDDKPLFLAIASGPPGENDNKFEFLIKKTEGNEWLTRAESGAVVEMSQVLGGGFPMKENMEGFKYDFPTQNVLLFAAGSGIAPIAAAIRSGQLQLDNGRLARLYYGERSAADLCFIDQYTAWEAAGVQVVPVLSQPEGDGAWQGRTGYIQTALEEDGIAIPRNSAALLCGMKGMTESVKELLTGAGMFEGRIMFNF